jgi:hypothetical protein
MDDLFVRPPFYVPPDLILLELGGAHADLPIDHETGGAGPCGVADAFHTSQALRISAIVEARRRAINADDLYRTTRSRRGWSAAAAGVGGGAAGVPAMVHPPQSECRDGLDRARATSVCFEAGCNGAGEGDRWDE